MSKKEWNPTAQKTIVQINSTLDMLHEKGLAISYNVVVPSQDSKHYCQITWNNHISDRSNSGKAFTKLEQYLHILKTNSYHCLLFDGSLIRANFEFEDDILLRQNLLWWPAPYDYGNILQEGYSPVDLLLDFYGDSSWHKVIKMRSPVRIDFDSSKNEANHPHSHLHIQNEETRLNTSNPMCFNRFVDFVLRNFYPQFTLPFSNHDFIQYKTIEFKKLDYVFSHIVV